MSLPQASIPIDLSHVSDEDLVLAVLGRIPKNGFFPPAIWDLITRIMPIPCVDGIAYRFRLDGKPEVLAILRNTSEAAGLWCVVGGRVKGGQSLEKETIKGALERHFKRDLGVDIVLDRGWRRPFLVGQVASLATDEFGLELAKHAIALRFLVRLVGTENFVFGEGDGGREVRAANWFTKETFPWGQCGYDHELFFVEAFRLLNRQDLW